MRHRLVGAFERFVGVLPSVSSMAQLADETLRAVESTGLDTMMAGMPDTGGDPTRPQFLFGNWPAAWRDHYPKLLGDDPLLVEIKLRLEPFTWTDLRARQPLSPDAAAVLATAAAWGLDRGLRGAGARAGLAGRGSSRSAATRSARSTRRSAASSPLSPMLPSSAAACFTSAPPPPPLRSSPPPKGASCASWPPAIPTRRSPPS